MLLLGHTLLDRRELGSFVEFSFLFPGFLQEARGRVSFVLVMGDVNINGFGSFRWFRDRDPPLPNGNLHG